MVQLQNFSRRITTKSSGLVSQTSTKIYFFENYNGSSVDNQQYTKPPTPSDPTKLFLKAFVGYNQFSQSFPMMPDIYEKKCIVFFVPKGELATQVAVIHLRNL